MRPVLSARLMKGAMCNSAQFPTMPFLGPYSILG
jgi:hypothetical protein